MVRRRLGGIVGWVLAGMLAAAPLAAGELYGSMLLTWQLFDMEGSRTDGLHQRYELGLDRALTDALDLDLRLRVEQDDSGATILGNHRETSFRRLDPQVRLTWARPTLLLTGESHWIEAKSRSEQGAGAFTLRQRDDRLRFTLDWTPVELPLFSFEAGRNRNRVTAFDTDVTEEWLNGHVGYEWEGLSVAAMGRLATLSDPGNGFESRSRNLGGQLGWAESFAADRLTLNANAYAGRTRFEDRLLGAAAAGVPHPVRIFGILVGHDATPQDHFDEPLVGNFLLRDGNLDKPAGVSLGPETATNLTLAVDLAQVQPVDELRVVARDPLGQLVTTGGAVEWLLWTSADGRLWAPLNGAVTRYEPGRGYWSVTFPRQQVRWLQIVTFFVNQVPTELTEVQAFNHVQAGGTEPDIRVMDSWGGGGGFSWRPVSRLGLSWQGAIAELKDTSELRPEGRNRDRHDEASFEWQTTARSVLSVTRTDLQSRARYRGREITTEHLSWRGAWRVAVNENLSAVLEGERSRYETDEETTITERLFVHGMGRIFPGLEILLDAGQQRQEFGRDDLRVTSPILVASVRADLTRTLRLTLLGSVREDQYSGRPEGPPVPRDHREDRWTADLTWQPGPQLLAGVMLGRASTSGSSTPLQSYRLLWSPWRGGALRLDARYDEDVDPALDRRSRRLQVGPRWQLNERAVLGCHYYLMETSVLGFGQTQQSLRATFSLNF